MLRRPNTPDTFPEECILQQMVKSVKYKKNTRHISKIFYFIRNGEDCNLYNIVWCQGGSATGIH